MKSKNLKDNFKVFCIKLGKKNIIIAGAVLLIAAAIIVNVALLSGKDNTDGFDYDQSAGLNDSTGNNAESTTGVNAGSENFFSSVQISRQRTRDEAIEVLQSVVDNESSTETAKNEALAEINKLAAIMEDEANIETLIEAKGFAECVAVISEDKISVVVKSEGLIPSQISQINEIVYQQSGILPVNITIIEK